MVLNLYFLGAIVCALVAMIIAATGGYFYLDAQILDFDFKHYTPLFLMSFLMVIFSVFQAAKSQQKNGFDTKKAADAYRNSIESN